MASPRNTECSNLPEEVGELYAKKLREAGNEVTYSRYNGTIHGFVSMAGVIDQGKAGIAEAAAALRRTLGT